jgi:hypothetical protein
MSLEQDNFESLRRLLALKRHETPPPGFYNRFPHEVIAQLEALQAGPRAAGSRRQSEAPSWLLRLWEIFEAKPLLAGGFGVVVCSFLIGGMILVSEGSPGVNGNVLVAGGPTDPVVDTVEKTNASTTGVVSIDNGNSLFDQLGPLRAEPVSFTVPEN